MSQPAEKPSANDLLRAAKNALRSYQYGNGSRDLAAAIADSIDDYLEENGQAPRKIPITTKVSAV